MATYKKKDFKKIKSEDIKLKEDKIEELVDSNGGELDDTDDVDGNELSNSEIQTGPTLSYDDKGNPTTTDDHLKAIQPRRDWLTGSGVGGIGGLGGLHGATAVYEEEELTEIAKAKMKKMVRELMQTRSADSEMVNRGGSADVNRNQIPDFDELSDGVKHASDTLIKMINDSAKSGDEVAIVLNHIISGVDTSDMSVDYKNLIKKNI